MGRLTETKTKPAEPRAKTYKVYDGAGLYLLVNPNGSKYWRYRYWFHRQEKTIALGVYPKIDLADARSAHFKYQKALAKGRDPSAVKAKKKAKLNAIKTNTFGVFAQSWFDRTQKINSNVTRIRNQRILDYLIRGLGNKTDITTVRRKELKTVIITIEQRHGTETAHRALHLAAKIFEDAASDDLINIDPCFGVRNSLSQVVPRHRVALTDPTEVGELIQAIWTYGGKPQTISALKLLAMTFTRPGELRQAKWPEIDFQRRLWVIPAERMKMRRRNPYEHLVPLSTQAVQVFSDLKKLCLDNKFVFPTNRPGRPLSENAFNVALRTMGYSGDKHTAHGFRTTASTLLHELNFSAEVIEAQLAHSRPGVAGIYNRSRLLPQRTTMMQQWADHLEKLRNGDNAAPSNTGAN